MDAPLKKALLFVNIGTPEDLSEEAVKNYLKIFLMDKYVIDIPYPLRWILVNMIIAPFRAKKSLAAYKEIWKKEGSPLKVYTEDLVKEAKKSVHGFDEISYAMAYSKPFIQEALEDLKDKGMDEIYFLPMYPQYAESTARSALEEAFKWAKKNRKLKLKSLLYYYDQESFVQASVDKIKTYQTEAQNQKAHYLFSFHGLPESHVKKLYSYCRNDQTCCLSLGEKNRCCYRAQCFGTARLLAQGLGLEDEQWSVSFQSRLGKAKWLSPYTVDKVAELAQEKGKQNLVVIPWAFTIDCLETEEEIEGEVKESFFENGGKTFTRVPCLNHDFSKTLTRKFLSYFRDIDEIAKEMP